MALLGNARVSTTRQDLERQLHALHAHGVPEEHTERVWNRERVAHARAVAVANGRQVGRPRGISEQRIRRTLALRQEGWTVAEIAAETGISPATLYRRWAELRHAGGGAR